MNDVSKTIGWCDYTWNPVVGCKNGCPYCYARRIRKRFNPDIPFEQITNYDERLNEPLKLKKPSKIFVGSMTDLFADWMPKYNVKYILEIVNQCPQHTFQFLTKNPKGYASFDFPENCWLGETITEWRDSLYGISPFNFSQNIIRFVSFEPLLGNIRISEKYPYDWVIIGAMTGPGSQKYQPKKEWIDEIVKQADQKNIPIYIKDNAHYPLERKEWPK